VFVRKTYFFVTVLLLIAVVAQFYFAALGVFGPQGEDDNLFPFHRINGSMVLPALSVLAVIFAALSRAGARTVWLSALPILLIAVQYLLFILGGAVGGGDEDNPTVGSAVILGLHAVNGLAIMGTIITLLGRARARAFGAASTDADTDAKTAA
jgi:heme A synthase